MAEHHLRQREGFTMLRTFLIMALAAGFWLLAHSAPAQTRVVGNPIGFVTPSGLVTDITIQSAVNALAGIPNGTIWVDATYNPANGPEVFPVCIPGVLIPIAPLTIQGNGVAPIPIPGNGTDKIFVISMPGVTIDNLDFSNAGSGDGNCGSPLALAGAIYAGSVNLLTIQNCTFFGNGNNLVTAGGAIFITNCSTVLIQNCSFIDNVALNTGGAIRVNASSDVTIQSCTFTDNNVPTAPIPGLDGGAISWWTSWGLIFDNDIGGFPPAIPNSAPYGGGLSIVSCATSPSLTVVTANRIKGNLAGAFGPCPWGGGHGGGIYIEDCPDSVLVGPANDIQQNAAVFFGGGIATVAYSLMTNPLIQDNLIHENAVWQECAPIPGTPRNGGGGIAVEAYNALWSDYPDIVQNNIRLNTTLMPNTFGGGIGVLGEYSGVGRPSAVISQNMINGNHTLG